MSVLISRPVWPRRLTKTDLQEPRIFQTTRGDHARIATTSDAGTGSSDSSRLWRLFGLESSKAEPLVQTWTRHAAEFALNKSLSNYSTCTEKKFPELARNQRHLLSAVAANFNISIFEKYQGIFRTHLAKKNYVNSVAYVTAASSDHFDESQGFFQNMWNNFQDKYTIIFYDVGLKLKQVNLLREKCFFCEYRKFNFTKYPSFVQQRRNYAFKALIAQEVLSEYDLFVWFDASIRFRPGTGLRNFSFLEDYIRSHEAMIWPGQFSFTASAMTHPYMFSFFNEHPCAMDQIHQQESGFYGISGSHFARKNILLPYVACALEPDCMWARHPYHGTPEHPCVYGYPKMRGYEFSGCHRYDQAALTLIFHRVLSEMPTPPWRHHTAERNHRVPDFLSKLAV